MHVIPHLTLLRTPPLLPSPLQVTQERLDSGAAEAQAAQARVEAKAAEVQRVTDRLKRKDLELEEGRRREQVCVGGVGYDHVTVS